LKKTEDLDRPFSLCGRRCYLIGRQNGLFPDFGGKRIGEMGGVWTHPIKIVDGFWLGIQTMEEGVYGYRVGRGRRWLTDCDEFVLGDGGAWVEHRYNLNNLNVIRREFIPYEDPALGIDIHISSLDKSISKVQLNFLVRFDILPTFFSGWPDPGRLEIEIKEKGERIVVHALAVELHPWTAGRWTAILGSDIPPSSIITGENLWGPEKTSGNGVSCLLKFVLNLDQDVNLHLALAGDCEGEQRATRTLNKLLNGYNACLERKINHFRYVANDLTLVETPDKLLNDAFLWSKLNLEWLTQTSPYMKMRIGDEWLIYNSPYVGTCVVAGHQEYPFYFGGDTEVSIAGILAAGLHDTAKKSLRLLGAVGKKQNGRIPHCVVTNGEIYDRGNIHESTLFVRAVWDTYLWTGDEFFLKELYPICCMSILDYTLKQPHKDGILLRETGDNPESPKEKACPSWLIWGLEAFADMAKIYGDNSYSMKAKHEAEKMKQQLEDQFWVEENRLYARMLDENNYPISDQQNNFWSYMHETIIAAYCGVAKKSRIDKALTKIERLPYTGDWGIYLAPKSGIMPYTTGKAAIAEFNYGRLEKGLRYIRMIAKTVGHIMPGAVPESIDRYGDPKKFRGWPYLQLWSASHINQGLVWGLLHIKPDAQKRKVVMQPQLPKDWPYAEFKNIKIGKSKINVRLEKDKIKVKQITGPKLEILINDNAIAPF
jgi:glycogen debranching enzyme